MQTLSYESSYMKRIDILQIVLYIALPVCGYIHASDDVSKMAAMMDDLQVSAQTSMKSVLPASINKEYIDSNPYAELWLYDFIMASYLRASTPDEKKSWATLYAKLYELAKGAPITYDHQERLEYAIKQRMIEFGQLLGSYQFLSKFSLLKDLAYTPAHKPLLERVGKQRILDLATLLQKASLDIKKTYYDKVHNADSLKAFGFNEGIFSDLTPFFQEALQAVKDGAELPKLESKPVVQPASTPQPFPVDTFIDIAHNTKLLARSI